MLKKAIMFGYSWQSVAYLIGSFLEHDPWF